MANPTIFTRALPLAKAVVEDADVRERAGRAALAARKLARRPASTVTRAQRASTALREIDGLVSAINRRAEKQRRARRRAATIRASLLLATSAGAAVAIRQRSGSHEPQPIQPQGTPNV